MGVLSVEPAGGKIAYRPRETVSGTASWTVAATPASAELRLVWYTAGKGTVDVSVVDTITFSTPRRSDSRSFSFALPLGPYSFSGKLISLVWALELVVEPGPDVARVDFALSPTGSEVLLGGTRSPEAPYEGA
jgi:hypothetical protein